MPWLGVTELRFIIPRDFASRVCNGNRLTTLVTTCVEWKKNATYTHTCILLVLAWKETWEISQHNLSAGDWLSIIHSLVAFEFSACTFFFLLKSSKNRVWFLFLEEFGSRSDEWKSKQVPPSKAGETIASPASCWLQQQSWQGLGWRGRQLGSWERARQQMFPSSHGTMWPTQTLLKSQFCTSCVTLGKLFNLSGSPFLSWLWFPQLSLASTTPSPSPGGFVIS